MQNQNDWNTMMVRADLEAYKLQTRAQIEVFKSEQIARQRADIASQRKLQQMRVIIENSGAVSLVKETFAGNVLKCLPIEIVENQLLVPVGMNEEVCVLYLVIKANAQQRKIWLTRNNFANKKLNESFMKAGIRFGFEERKEREIQKLFVIAATSVAQRVEIPVEHGWFWNGSQYCYAGPKEIVWKEAVRNAER